MNSKQFNMFHRVANNPYDMNTKQFNMFHRVANNPYDMNTNSLICSIE